MKGDVLKLVGNESKRIPDLAALFYTRCRWPERPNITLLSPQHSPPKITMMVARLKIMAISADTHQTQSPGLPVETYLCAIFSQPLQIFNLCYKSAKLVQYYLNFGHVVPKFKIMTSIQ